MVVARKLGIGAYPMSRAVIIVLLAIGIVGQVFRMWVAQHIASQLAAVPRVALWVKHFSMLSLLLLGGLFLLLPEMPAPLETVLIASLVVWIVSSITFHYGVRSGATWSHATKSTWSPFQSPEVREICTHLTPTEHARLINDARERGRLIALWFALPLAIIVLALWHWQSWRLRLVLVTAFAGYFVLWILPRFRAMRRRSIEMLCETECGRSHNYMATRLRLMTFPWSK